MSLSRFERTLIASGAKDAPSPERRSAAREAVLRAAGVSASAAILTTAKTATGATGATTVTTATTAAGVNTMILAKVLVVAVLGASGALAVSAATGSSGHGVAATAPASSVPSAAVRVRVAASTEMPAIPVIDVNAMADAPPETAQPEPVAPAVTIPPRPVEDPLAVEARLLETARACLASGDRACARARVAEHDARFARGALADEAAVLTIDIALADGDRDEARRLAIALLQRRSEGAWPSRVRKIAGDDP